MESHSWKSFLIKDHADIKRLDYVTRYNSIPSIYHESVSQHSYWVTLYALMLHQHIFSGKDPEIELHICKMGMIHDIGECLTGDVVRTFKYSSPELKRVIDESEEMMMTKYMPMSIKRIIGESQPVQKDDAKYVKDIIKAADFISLFHYMNREYNRGNREIMPFLNRMISDSIHMSQSLDKNLWYSKHLSSLYSEMSVLVTHEETIRDC